jgi:hypothetical protein
MSLLLTSLRPTFVSWVYGQTSIPTFWANQKMIRPPTYPYNVIEVTGLESEVGSSSPEQKFTVKQGEKILRHRVNYKVLTLNVQCLAGEISENSIDAFDVLSDLVTSLWDQPQRTAFCEVSMVPISWEPILNLTAIQHHEFISRAAVDVMFRVSNTVIETLDSTKTIVLDIDVNSQGQSETVTATAD